MSLSLDLTLATLTMGISSSLIWSGLFIWMIPAPRWLLQIHLSAWTESGGKCLCRRTYCIMLVLDTCYNLGPTPFELWWSQELYVHQEVGKSASSAVGTQLFYAWQGFFFEKKCQSGRPFLYAKQSSFLSLSLLLSTLYRLLFGLGFVDSITFTSTAPKTYFLLLPESLWPR